MRVHACMRARGRARVLLRFAQYDALWLGLLVHTDIYDACYHPFLILNAPLSREVTLTDTHCIDVMYANTRDSSSII